MIGTVGTYGLDQSCWPDPLPNASIGKRVWPARLKLNHTCGLGRGVQIVAPSVDY